MKNLYKIFFTITIMSTMLLVYVIYQDKSFKSNPLSKEIQQNIKQKEYHLKQLVYKEYHIKVDIPVIISSKLPNNLFGLASYDNGNIKIYLNRNRFQESSSYMIDYVLPHEYAHALMFIFNKFPKQNGGHTKQWQKICLSLEGKKCDRFVKHNDIMMGKLEFLY
jgi:hypothetical protein